MYHDHMYQIFNDHANLWYYSNDFVAIINISTMLYSKKCCRYDLINVIERHINTQILEHDQLFEN